MEAAEAASEVSTAVDPATNSRTGAQASPGRTVAKTQVATEARQVQDSKGAATGGTIMHHHKGQEGAMHLGAAVVDQAATIEIEPTQLNPMGLLETISGTDSSILPRSLVSRHSQA